MVASSSLKEPRVIQAGPGLCADPWQGLHDFH